jgi:hypothetical protein
VRIRVSEAVLTPSLIRGPGSSAILSINTDLSFEEIERVIGHQFAEGERDLAYALWADDETERIFTPIEGTSDFFIDLRPQH